MSASARAPEPRRHSAKKSRSLQRGKQKRRKTTNKHRLVSSRRHIVPSDATGAKSGSFSSFDKDITLREGKGAILSLSIFRFFSFRFSFALRKKEIENLTSAVFKS